MPTKRLPLALMATLLNVVNARHLKKYNNITSTEIISDKDGNKIPLIIFRPENLPESSPALVYCHGGAFVFKHAPAHLDNAARYAREANCLVIFVDYRLAPKHPFPAGFNDCYTALLWSIENASELGIDKHRIVMGGDSSGGAFAAAAAQKAIHEDKIKLCGQMLIYPATDSSNHWPSMKAFANVPPFKEHSGPNLWDAYLGHPLSDGVPPYAAPLQGEVNGVAAAYVETAEFCILLDQGNAYAESLQDKGVAVSINPTKGTVHGFDLMAPESEISKAAVTARINFLRNRFQLKS